MTLVAAHRGGAHLWPENAMPAFRGAIALGVPMVEFDVHQTRDGVPVVHHDPTIDRMTDGRGAIGDLALAALRRHVILGTGGEAVPTLDEVLDILVPAGVLLRVEIKPDAGGASYDGLADRLAGTLVARGLVRRALVTSFHLPLLAGFRAALAGHGVAAGDLHGLMWLCGPLVLAQCGTEGALAAMRAHEVGEIGLKASGVDDAVFAAMRARGAVVHGWAANDAALAARMFALGVASFTTDRPDLALAARPAGG